MKRWKGRSLLVRMVVPSLVPAFVAFCLIGPLSWPVAVWAQQAPGTGQTVQPTKPQQLTPLGAELEAYRYKGYLVLGPMPLTQYDGSKATLSQSSGDITIDLRNKKFTVKDGNALPTSVDSIKRGGRVYVCSGPDEVVVYVSEKKGGATNVAH